MRLLLWFVLAFHVSDAFASDPKFPVSAIPEELKKNADAIIREYELSYSILSRDKAHKHVHAVITILNEKGKHFATEVITYDKLSKVTMFKASAYDANGNIAKKLKTSEIYDQSAFDGLYGDNRLKAADVTQGTYPYTVEFEYEIDYKFLFHVTPFFLVSDERISVQRSSYVLTYASTNLKPRYKAFHISSDPQIVQNKNGSESMVWSFENIKPMKFESYGPSETELIPHVLAAPSQFEYDGYTGNMNSWDEFGLWIKALNQGRNVLPEETKKKILQLTADKKTQEEKIRAIYEYMQSKTRYVSIQLGIGGYQPFEANVVDQTGYGDCKALSNYLVSMLEVVGIKAYYALINSGPEALPLQQDFPSSQFNHAIAAVPNGNDTLWLECTSQTIPFAYLGRHTDDRKALLITETGAKIVNTTAYPAEVNVQSRQADVLIKSSGDATAKVKTVYSGLQYENNGLHSVLNNQYDLQKKWVMNTTDIPSFDINSFRFENKKDKIPSATVSLDLSLRKLASVSGKRLMLTPNLMNRNTYIPEKLEARKSEIVEDFGFMDSDTIRYHIPDEIYPEVLPQPVKVSSRFGEYESTYTLDQGLVVYTRRLKINKGKYPASAYQEFIDFYKSINRADNTKLVFLNKT